MYSRQPGGKECAASWIIHYNKMRWQNVNAIMEPERDADEGGEKVSDFGHSTDEQSMH